MNKELDNITEGITEKIKKRRPVNHAYHHGIDGIRVTVARDYSLNDVENVLEYVIQKGYTYNIINAVSKHGMEAEVLIEEEETLEDYVEMGLAFDGGRHKQWCLHQIAERLDIDHKQFEEGIPP